MTLNIFTHNTRNPTIDIETSYLNRIIELSDELNHYVHQYNSLVLKRKTKEENNAVNINKKEKEKAPKKN